jgi:acetolactate synthase-1/2/3 large subunit
MLVIGGQGPRFFADMGSLQDMNHVELMRPITKWSVSVPDTRRLGEYVATAFRKAMAGVPGPVFLEMPLDLLMNQIDEAQVVTCTSYRTEARPAGEASYLDRAADLIRSAERPMLIVGSQLRWSENGPAALRRFVDTTRLPAFLNGMARGALPPDHPSFLAQTRKVGLKDADVVIVFGTPFDFRLGYGKPPKFHADAKVIQVDLDGEEIGRNRPVDVGIIGDTGLVLAALADRLAAADLPDWSGWLAGIREQEAAKIAKIEEEGRADGAPISPLRLCRELRDLLPDDAIVIGDGGDFVASAAYTLRLGRPFSWMDPGPLGTLGVGPGYAMAAKLAHPGRTVVIVYGDGSFGLNGFELEAMARQGIPVVAVIGNDAAWTQIRRGQISIYGPERAPATELAFTRYDQVAEALGCHGEWCERAEEVRPALEAAFRAAERGQPAVVNVKIGGSDFRKNAISV